MHPHFHWGNRRAEELRAEAQQQRLARQAQRPAQPHLLRNVLRLLRPAKRPRLT